MYLIQTTKIGKNGKPNKEKLNLNKKNISHTTRIEPKNLNLSDFCKLLFLFLCYPKNKLLLCTKFRKYGHETVRWTIQQAYNIGMHCPFPWEERCIFFIYYVDFDR